jgi:signal transduction histidine kinase
MDRLHNNPIQRNDIASVDTSSDEGLPFDDQASCLAELGSLASMLAHEINNQMTRAQAHTQLALRNQHTPHEPDAAYHTLEQLLPIIKRTALLTESMMQYAQPEGAEETPTRSCEIHEVHAVAQSFASPVAPASDPIVFTLSSNTQGINPEIDATALEQVLINLYMNAARSIQERRETDPSTQSAVIINATLECSTWNTPHIRITVQDSGQGINTDDLPNIFQPWNRGGSRRSNLSRVNGGGDPMTSLSTGHGLGLAVCEKLITNAGGSIQCESTPDIGTTFTILLPASMVDQDSATPDAQAA